MTPHTSLRRYMALTALAFVAMCVLSARPGLSQSTIGVGPTNAGNGQTTASVSGGQNGLSTGSSVNFRSGSQSSYSSSVVRSTSENAQGSASLSTESVQEQGSNGGFSSTTGSAISGISDSISGGFTVPSTAGTNVQGSVSSSGNGAAMMTAPFLGPSSARLLDAFFVNGLVLTTMILAGAIFVL